MRFILNAARIQLIYPFPNGLHRLLEIKNRVMPVKICRLRAMSLRRFPPLWNSALSGGTSEMVYHHIIASLLNASICLSAVRSRRRYGANLQLKDAQLMMMAEPTE
ncbi:hypothetical protein NL30_37840 [Burkholderia contaminans]|nr:hypothetical protein NL30_37840 [Burkholderia contaminans]